MISSVVIVGSGHAGFQCAASLRQEGFDGRVLLVGEDPAPPYQRPPLSKAYLQGRTTAESLAFRPETFYTDQRIERIHGRAIAIDRARGLLTLDDGRTLIWDRLVLATGSQHRKLEVPGADLHGVYGLQHLADADALKAGLRGSRHAVVVGAGFIGLEFAAFARSTGLSVHVVELGTRPLARAVGPSTSEHVRALHEQAGTRFLWGQGVAALLGERGRLTAVTTTAGTTLPADIVLVGIGAVPNVHLATSAGLPVDNGICVNDALQTADPRIFAIGDVAAFPHPRGAGRLRLESVQSAGDQARTVAARIAGKPMEHKAVPWFWSDQGDTRLQIAGVRGAGNEDVALAEVDVASGARTLTVLAFEGDRLNAVETVNRPADHMLARRLLATGARLAPAEARAPGFSLKAWAARPA